MILTFQTDIPTFQANFLRSDDCVMSLEFRGQKVWFFRLLPRGPPQTNIIITQKWLNSRIPEKLRNSWFRPNVARATRNTFAGQTWPAGRVFVTPALQSASSSSVGSSRGTLLQPNTPKYLFARKLLWRLWMLFYVVIIQQKWRSAQKMYPDSLHPPEYPFKIYCWPALSSIVCTYCNENARSSLYVLLEANGVTTRCMLRMYLRASGTLGVVKQRVLN